MPVCPNCKYEYVNGITICPDCNISLVEIKEFSKSDEVSEKDWVLIYTSFSEIDINMIKGNLESADIGVFVLSQKDSSFPAPGDLSLIKLMVKEADVQSALEFIQEIKSKSSELDEDDV